VAAAADPNVHADEHHRLPVHGAGVQLLPQVLRPGGRRRGVGLQVPRHALGASRHCDLFIYLLRQNAAI